jgi:hypothetical protein
MSSVLHVEGTRKFTVAASDKLAVFSKDRVKIYTRESKPAGLEGNYALLTEVAAETEYLSAAFTVATDVILEADSVEVFYAAGTAPVVTERRGLRGQGAPGALNATGTLTAALIGAGIVTSTSAAPVVATLDTGAVMDAAVQMEIGESFDWSVINTGPSAFTVTAAASGHTVVGVGAVATVTSGLFRTRKTAADTFVTYRIG